MTASEDPRGKKPAVVLKNDGNTPGTASLRQQGLTLVAGETYKLSARSRPRASSAAQAA